MMFARAHPRPPARTHSSPPVCLPRLVSALSWPPVQPIDTDVAHDHNQTPSARHRSQPVAARPPPLPSAEAAPLTAVCLATPRPLPRPAAAHSHPQPPAAAHGRSPPPSAEAAATAHSPQTPTVPPAAHSHPQPPEAAHSRSPPPSAEAASTAHGPHPPAIARSRSQTPQPLATALSKSAHHRSQPPTATAQGHCPCHQHTAPACAQRCHLLVAAQAALRVKIGSLLAVALAPSLCQVLPCTCCRLGPSSRKVWPLA